MEGMVISMNSNSFFGGRISGAQTVCLLLLFSMFSLMTMPPDENIGFKVQLAAAAVSALIQAMIAIPLVMLLSPENGLKRGFWGIVCRILYCIFFLAISANVILESFGFLEKQFYRNAGKIGVCITLAVLCGYCAFLGIEGLARSSAVMLTVLFIVTIALILPSVGKADISVFMDRSFVYSGQLPKAVYKDLSRGGEIVAAVFLAGYSKENIRKPFYTFIAVKLLVTCGIIFAVGAIGGRFAYITDYPFMSLSAFADDVLFGRTDAVFMAILIISGIISAAFYLLIASELICGIFDVRDKNVLLSFPVSAVLCILLTFADGYVKYLCSGVPIILLFTVIPLIIILLNRRKKEASR